jgi:hypothetical protein
MWPLIDGVTEALNDYEFTRGGLLVCAAYKYFDWELIKSVKMNGMEVLEYWTVVEVMMEA